eukprot:6214496-Pleurochrysis_carterae.AAC.2
MGELCKKYGLKKSARIVQEYSNIKRLHSKQLQEMENGALGVIWGRHIGELLGGQEGTQDKARKDKVLGVIEKRRTAECWEGEEYLTKCDNGVQRWIHKQDVQSLNGEDADKTHKEREFVRESTTTFAEHMRDDGIEATQETWDHTWREFLSYAQRGDRKDTARENVMINSEGDTTHEREPYPTLYSGEVVGRTEEDGEIRTRGRNMARLSETARNNKHKQERKGETYGEKRARLAKGGEGSRVESIKPARKEGGGEWTVPERREDTAARKIIRRAGSEGETQGVQG